MASNRLISNRYARRALLTLLVSALLPFGSSALAQTVADGYFVESGGLLVIEAESIGALPDSWKDINTHSSPNITGGSPTGSGFITWGGNQSLRNPGVSTLVFPIEINNAGTYRFRWRNQVGRGTNTTEHNDTWLKISSTAFYGLQGNDSVVCPKGLVPDENSCQGSAPEGAGANGWFKVYSSGANNWSFSTRTSDNDAHNIFVRFDQPGLYEIRLSARSSDHIIDRMVLSSNLYQGNPEIITLPESQFVPGDSSGDKLTVDASGQWFEREGSGTRVFMAGVGGPEGFLFETDARKQEIVDQLISQEVNALYFHSLRSFEGDGYSFEDPFVVNEDVTSAVDSDVLDNWRFFLDQLDDNDIISWFHIIDDTARPWGCSVPLSADAKRYIGVVVNRFKDLDNLVWLSGEEFLMGSCSAAEDRALMRAIAAEIRLHDPVHPIGVHHNNGQAMQFDAPDEPVINVFAQQICGNQNVRNPDGIHAAAQRGDWVYVMAECHPWHLQLLGADNRRMLRLSNWATAMAGGYVLMYNAYECQERGKLCSLDSNGNPVSPNDPHDPSTGMLGDLRRLREFMEASRFSELSPADQRATGETDWVLANDSAGAWIAYSNNTPEVMGISGLGNAELRLRWFNPASGAEVVQLANSQDSPFAVPGSLGEDVALFVERTGGSPPPPANLGVSLVNADADNIVGPLTDDAVLSIADLDFTNWSAVVTGSPENTASVTLNLSGSETNNQTENVAPYTLFGDSGGDYAGVPLQVGNYVLEVRAHSGANGGGAVLASLVVDFIIVADGNEFLILKDGFEAP